MSFFEIFEGPKSSHNISLNIDYFKSKFVCDIHILQNKDSFQSCCLPRFASKYSSFQIHIDLHFVICDALRDLVPFVQFENREKHHWSSVDLSKVAG